MAVTTESFKADGFTRIFTPSSTILSQNHIRVDYYLETSPGDLHYITPDEWDLVNNSIIFKEAPTNDRVIVVSISTTGEDLNEPLSAVQVVASIKDDVVYVANNDTNIHRYYATYLEPSSTEPTKRNDGSELQTGDLFFNITTNKMMVFSKTNEWIQISYTGNFADSGCPLGHTIGFTTECIGDEDVFIQNGTNGFTIETLVLNENSSIIIDTDASYKII